MKDMHDLIVVGGGPGGASAAERAASLGLRVLLFEKEAFPRYKPCGGAVSKQALSCLGGSIPRDLIENEIYGVRIKYKEKTVEAMENERLAVLVDRGAFDHYVLERARKAGAEVRHERIRDFVEEEGRVRVISQGGQEYTGIFAVIAEGAHGKLKYKVRDREARDKNGMCLVTEIGMEDGERPKVPANMLEIQFGVTRMGYGWIFPHKRHYSVGMGGLASKISKPRTAFANFLQANNFPPETPFKGHAIPFGWHKKKPLGKRVLLCGDAGGFVDTFFGEGIAYALRSGQIAAECIASTLKKTAPDLTPYIKACRSEFSVNLKYSYILSRMIDRYPHLLFSLFVSQDKYVKAFLEIPKGKSNYKKVFFNILKDSTLSLPLIALKERRSPGQAASRP